MRFLEDAYRIINKYNQKAKTAKHYGTEDLLYSAEVHMIELIGSYEAITTTQLAEKLGITKGAISQITRKLLEKNLIVKNPSAERSNEVLISLTDKGRIVYSYHQSMHEKMLNKIDSVLSDLSDEEKMVMDKIIQIIDESLNEI